MTDKDNGGPAFPWGEHGTHLGGATLRDYFAAAALNGLLASSTIGDREAGPFDDARKARAAAFSATAYQAADAMLKERAK